MKFAAIALAVALACSTQAHASELPEGTTETVAVLQVNGTQVRDTDLFALGADGDLWMPVEVWAAIPNVRLPLGGKSGYVSARSLGLDTEMKESEQAINLKVPARLLPSQSFGQRGEKVTEVAPAPRGVLVNYDLAARAGQDGTYGVSLGHEARAGVAGGTFVTTGQLNADANGVSYTRGLTSWRRDNLQSGTTVQIGDVFTPRTNLGGQVNLAGIRIGTDRGLQQGERFYPVPLLGGIAQDTATADVLINGAPAGKHNLKPGPWQLDNFALRPGANDISVVVRDEFGREEVVQQRFYMTDKNLPKGRTEWEVTAGLVREEGDTYTTPALAARVERGITDQWTLGGSVQATPDGRQVQLSNRFVLGTRGALSVDAAGSQSENGQGSALAVAYDYKSRNFAITAGYTRYSDDYWTVANSRSDGGAGLGLESAASIGVGFTPQGKPWSASVSATQLTYHDGGSRQRFDAGARWRGRYDDVAFGLRYDPREKSPGVYIGWSHDFGQMRASTTVERAPEIAVSGNLSGRSEVAGLPVNWTVAARESATDRSVGATASTQTSKGALRASAIYRDGDSSVDARFSGSAWIGEGGVTFQPTVRSSFLLVEVPGQKGVPVAAGGSFLTKTNSRGVAVIHNVVPLKSQAVSIDATGLPMEVSVASDTQRVAIGRLSGGKVRFELTSEKLVELRLTRGGQPIQAGAKVRSDTEEQLVGFGGVAVLMKPKAGQELLVDDGAQCLVRLPKELPTFTEIIELDCEK